jgi:hypothetical protein
VTKIVGKVVDYNLNSLIRVSLTENTTFRQEDVSGRNLSRRRTF